MSVWIWMGCVAIFSWASYQLWRAATLGRIGFGVVDFTRSDNPISFWFQVMLKSLSAILFGGGMLLVLAHSAGLI